MVSIVVVSQIILILLLMKHSILLNRLENIFSNRKWAAILEGVNIFGEKGNHKIWKMIILSYFFQGVRITGMYAVAISLGIKVPFYAFFIIVPIVYIATLLPISLGGLGVREGAMVFLMSRLGVSTVDGVSLAFLIYLNLVFIGLVGGVLQFAVAIQNRYQLQS
jgi:uncharacterized membrane protein YbhN (UPF0104 family)